MSDDSFGSHVHSHGRALGIASSGGVHGRIVVAVLALDHIPHGDDFVLEDDFVVVVVHACHGDDVLEDDFVVVVLVHTWHGDDFGEGQFAVRPSNVPSVSARQEEVDCDSIPFGQ